MYRAIAMAPGEGVTMPNPVGGPVTFKVRGAETGGALTALETVVAPGEGPLLHVHGGEEELLYVLEGEVRFRLGDDWFSTAPGGCVFVPRGVPHAFQNVGEAPARMLVVFTPAGMERFFERFAELAPARPPAEAFTAAGRTAGMDVVGPPLAVSDPV
jgi:quercetin dioxygenase-like cupin family protein